MDPLSQIKFLSPTHSISILPRLSMKIRGRSSRAISPGRLFTYATFGFAAAGQLVSSSLLAVQPSLPPPAAHLSKEQLFSGLLES